MMPAPLVERCLRSLRSPRLLAVVAAAVAWCGPDVALARAESAAERAAALRQAGQFAEAIDILREEKASIIRADGEQSLLLLPVEDLTAEILIDQGSVDEAAKILDGTISVRKRLAAAGVGGYDKELGAALLSRVRLLVAAKRLPDAVTAAREALTAYDTAAGPRSGEVATARTAVRDTVDALERFLGPGDDATIAARDGAATTFASLGMYADAIDQRRRILDCLAARGTVDPSTSLSATEQLGRLMMVAGRADEAIPVLKESTSAGSLTATRLLGELQVAADQFIAADASFTGVLEALRATERVPTCGSSSDRLRRMLIGMRRGTSQPPADELAQELRILAKPTPDERLAAIEGLVVAGDIFLARREPAAVIEQLTRALSTASAVKPPPAAWVADISGRLAAAHLALGDTAAALKLGEPALKAAEKELGPGDARTSTLRLVLADALRQGEQADKGLDLLDKALDRDLPRPDYGWEQAAVSICDRLATGERGMDLPDRYVAARVRQFGEGHPHVGRAWNLFGAARLAAGDWAAAVDRLSRAVPVLQAGLGDDHPEVAASQTLLAHAQRAAGAPGQAAETASRAVTAWERIAGPNHPGTLAAAEVLVAARLQGGDTTGVEELLKRLIVAETNPDPVRRSAHLVRFATLTSSRDEAAARECLQTALALPCWDSAMPTRAGERQRLAFTAARAAYAFKTLGDPTRSEDALRRARSLALKLDDSRRLLETLEKLAADGAEPAVAGT